MKVVGELHLGVSVTYSKVVGNADAKSSMMICPPADQVKASIWPGVSTKM